MACGIRRSCIHVFLFCNGKHDIRLGNRLVGKHVTHPSGDTLLVFFLHCRSGVDSLHHGIQVIATPTIHHHQQVKLVCLIGGMKILIQPAVNPRKI